MMQQTRVMTAISPVEEKCDKARVWLSGRVILIHLENMTGGEGHSFPLICEWDISFRLTG